MLQVAWATCADDSLASTALNGAATTNRSELLIHIKHESAPQRCCANIVALQRGNVNVCRLAAKKAPRVSRSMEKSA